MISSFPGTDVSSKILPSLKIELTQSLLAAGRNPNKLKLTNSITLLDESLSEDSNSSDAEKICIQAKVRY